VLVVEILFVVYILLCSLLPADTCALYGDGDLAFLECLAILNLLFAGRCLCHPKVVLWVGVNTNVLHGRLDCGGGGGCRHVGGSLCCEHNRASVSSE
jgi:hypothetical protein